MNSINQNNDTNETANLKTRCQRLRIEAPGDFPTPAQVIPLVEQRLAEHANHPAATCSEFSGDFFQWKRIRDAYQNFLDELRAADKPAATNIFSDQNSGQNSKPSPTQPDPEWPKSGQHWPDSGQDLPDAGQHRPDHCQTLPNNGQTTQSTPSTESTKSTDASTTSQTDHDCDDDENDEDEDEGSEEENEDMEEADLEAELAGYTNDAEHMAEAAADLQAHRKKRSRFDSLTADDQAAIIVMLDTHDSRTVARTLAKPQPIGMNFKISKSGLNYWARRYKNRQAELRVHQNVQAATDLIDKSSDPDKAFQQALERLLRIRTLTLTSEPNAPLDTIDALITTINKLRKQSLAERKQLHAEKSK